jgi:Cu/Ag efflux protein CusF
VRSLTVLGPVLATTLLIVALLAAPAFGAETGIVVETRPGAGGAAAAVTASGTITAIDAETRTVTIKGDGGRVLSLVAGPDVRNFAQLTVGQRVNAEYVQALTLELKSGSTAPISRTVDAALAGAQEGATPAGMLGQRVTIVAEVVGLDPETTTITLKGPERTVDLAVKPEQFALVKMGDRVEVVYVEAAALSVEPSEE